MSVRPQRRAAASISGCRSSGSVTTRAVAGMSATTDWFRCTTTRGGDVIDPVPGPVRAWHPADEQDAILLVQEDLYPSALSRPSSRRRQIDDLTTKQRGADAVIHGPSSIAHANIIAVSGPGAPRGREKVSDTSTCSALACRRPVRPCAVAPCVHMNSYFALPRTSPLQDMPLMC